MGGSQRNSHNWSCHVAIGALVLAALGAGPAGAQSSPAPSASCTLSDPQKGTVAEIKDGDTLTLTDGTVVRLIGAKAPMAPAGWRGDTPWPMVSEAKEALAQLATHAEVELRYGGTRADRHGNALAQVFVVKGDERVWLQGELVAKGLARVYSFPDNRACVSDLLAREATARDKHLGLWGASAYRVVNAEDVERLGRLTRSYQLVEGQVAKVGGGGGRVYLNFADDWKSDFTVSIERKDSEALKAAGLDVTALAGKRVRVRGWLEWRNGPMIEVSHIEQIEQLPDGAGPARQAPETPAPGAIAL
jgi:micrococcal nuclease